MNTNQIPVEKLQLAANTIRALSMDGVEKANSGHPGMPMGMADLAAVLWLKFLKFNPAEPKWINRDRFVLSNGHGSMLLYSLLHLSGYKVTLEDLKSFRQWGSLTPGHPENFLTDGVECTTGPLGQGIANAVGMALGEKILAARYNTEAQKIIDHKVYCFVGDGCLMEGVSSEASSVAGHLGLDNLVVIYDSNHISIAGHTKLAFTEDVAMRYEAYGWHVCHVDGHDVRAIEDAISAAVAVKGKPKLIVAKTIIGKGSPNKADSHDVHGSPLGADEMALTKKAMNWPLEPTFYIPKEVQQVFAERIEVLSGAHNKWKDSFNKWSAANSSLASQLKQQISCDVPGNLNQILVNALPSPAKPAATRKLSEAVLQIASQEVPALIGGSADLEPSTLTLIKGSTDISRESFSGKNIRFGVREHGMGSIMNGLSYYGGYIPYGSTFFCFTDYMRPAMRLAALSHLPGIFILTHDSIFLGEDGPTHQPIEHLSSLRAMPNMLVLRPADGIETAICYSIALQRKHGPCALVLTRQNVDPIERPENFSFSLIEQGAYSVYESGTETPEVTFIATGSEVGLALKAAKLLGKKSRVVSMPCAELFKEQPAVVRDKLIVPSSKKIVIEAGSTFGWIDIVGGSAKDTIVVGLDRFGASAPANILAEKFGFTPEAVVARVKEKFFS